MRPGSPASRERAPLGQTAQMHLLVHDIDRDGWGSAALLCAAVGPDQVRLHPLRGKDVLGPLGRFDGGVEQVWVASQALYRLVRERVDADRHLPLLRWAALLGRNAAEILTLVLRPDPEGERRLLDHLVHEAPDPNRNRHRRALAVAPMPLVAWAITNAPTPRAAIGQLVYPARGGPHPHAPRNPSRIGLLVTRVCQRHHGHHR